MATAGDVTGPSWMEQSAEVGGGRSQLDRRRRLVAAARTSPSSGNGVVSAEAVPVPLDRAQHRRRAHEPRALRVPRRNEQDVSATGRCIGVRRLRGTDVRL